jgi:hypothetical protein
MPRCFRYCWSVLPSVEEIAAGLRGNSLRWHVVVMTNRHVDVPLYIALARWYLTLSTSPLPYFLMQHRAGFCFQLTRLLKYPKIYLLLIFYEIKIVFIKKKKHYLPNENHSRPCSSISIQNNRKIFLKYFKRLYSDQDSFSCLNRLIF